MRASRQGRGLRRNVTIAMGVWLAAMAATLGAWAQGSLEYDVKAAYLYKLGPFITWPEGAFANASDPVQLCVAGDNPFGPDLARAVATQRIEGRSIVVRLLPRASRGSGCHIMYLAGSEAQSPAEALAVLEGEPVLAVTDAARDPAAKGIIHFVIHENRVRFEIDDVAAARSGLGISSKVLDLALAVRSRTTRVR